MNRTKEDYTKRPGLLIVEGYSDLRFYAELLEHLGCHTNVWIKEFNGKKDLWKKLETFLTPDLLAEKRTIAVILDADESGPGTDLSLTNRLEQLTGRKLTCGNWSAGDGSRDVPMLGYYVVPSPVSQGEMETLVWQAWANDERNLASRGCIESFLKCMSAAGYEAKSPEKGLISALLAVRNDEDPRLGPGAQAKVFDFNCPEFADIKKFLSGFASG